MEGLQGSRGLEGLGVGGPAGLRGGVLEGLGMAGVLRVLESLRDAGGPGGSWRA